MRDEMKITMKSEGGNGANSNEGWWSRGQAGDASLDHWIFGIGAGDGDGGGEDGVGPRR